MDRRLYGSLGIGFASVLLGVGCSGGGSTAPQRPVSVVSAMPTTTPVAGEQTTSVALSIRIPAQMQATAARTRHYVASTTASFAFTVAQNNIVKEKVTDSVGTPACTANADKSLTCAYTLAGVPVGANVTIAAQAFDASSNLLSEGTIASQTVVLDQANQIAITLHGDVAKVVMTLPAPIPACSPTSAALSVTAQDADGNVITGTYDNPIALTASGPAPRGTATPNASVSPAAVSAANTTAPILTFDGKSPGSTTITATVAGASVGSFTFAPVPKVCAEYTITEAAAGEVPQPRGITAGSDGNIYVTEYQGHNVDRVATTSSTTVPVGTIVTFPVTVAATSGSLQTDPFFVTNGPDGNLWLTDPFNGVITVSESNPTTQTAYPADSTNGETNQSPKGIAVGPGPGGTANVLWYVQQGVDSVATITTAGSITHTYPVTASGNPNTGLFQIAEGPDSNMWFTEQTANAIGTLNSSTGALATYPVTTQNALPSFIAPGYDKALWFTESNANQIGRISTTGTVSEYPVISANSEPRGIVAGLDGNLYFAEQNANGFGRITPGGSVVEFPAIAASSGPYAITVGGDNNLWFTEITAGNVGYIGY